MQHVDESLKRAMMANIPIYLRKTSFQAIFSSPHVMSTRLKVVHLKGIIKAMNVHLRRYYGRINISGNKEVLIRRIINALKPLPQS